MVIDLIASCLASGATELEALMQVATASTTSLKTQLHRVVAALSVGGSHDEAWQQLSGDELAPVVDTMCRTAKSGTPAADQLHAIARDLRVRARESAINDARQLGVRTAGPLGLCFLPAFVLVGVVPLVISLVQKWT